MRTSPFSIRCILLIVVVAAWGAGCRTAYKTMRADPPKNTSFLPHPEALVRQPPDAAFDESWCDPTMVWSNYHSIIVAPVSLAYLHLDTNQWDILYRIDKSIFFNISNECARLARDMEVAFMKAIEEDPHKRFKLAQAPQPGTLKLELALLEFIPSQAVVNTVANVVGLISWPFGLAAMTPATAGRVAMAGKLSDSESGQILAMFADREMDQPAIVNLSAMTWRGTAEHAIRSWSKEFVRLANATNFADVKAAMPFQVIVW